MLIGKGVDQGHLHFEDINALTAEALDAAALTHKRVLFLIPDATRKAPIDVFFRVIYAILAHRVAALDFLVASGTHRPLSQERILERVGITPAKHARTYHKARFFAHVPDDPTQLRVVGTLTAGEMAEISDGLIREPLTITINKRLFDYDLVAILGPVVPHETAGFAGGNKYFFPGVAGTEIISSFHWIGALITNQVINGLKDNPVRRILDQGAAFLTFNKLCFSFVVREDGELACLFIGSPEESWSRAVDYSARIHITYKDKPYRRILGLAPTMYDDLWVGGKVMYKLEPILADGGELVIYAPHIKALSHTHEAAIREVGYHVPEYFLKQWDRFAQASRLIMAHSTNVRGGGTYDDGVERPRVKVTLATGIPEELCRQVNLGFLNPDEVDISRWRQREADGVLVVEHAGQVLYRLKSS